MGRFGLVGLVGLFLWVGFGRPGLVGLVRFGMLNLLS